MQYREIIYEKQDKVAIVTLNRPARLNAITPTLAGEFKDAMLDAERDPCIAAIVVTGAGKSFCPGMDMATLQSAAEQTGQAGQPAPSSTNIDHHSLFGFMLKMRKPIVGAINGNCVGMGFSMALQIQSRDPHTHPADTASLHPAEMREFRAS